MPFSRPAKISLDIDCVSLQVHKPEKKIEKNKKSSYCGWKRAYLFTSTGSITIEAAMITALFMMVVVFVQSFMLLIGSQLTMQRNMNNIVKSSAERAFYLQIADEVSEYNKSISDIKMKLQEKSESTEQMEEVEDKKYIDVAYLMVQLMACTKAEAWNNSYINGGIAGIRLTESSVANGQIDMIAQYSMKVPFVNQSIYVSQRAFMKDWTGVDITKSLEVVYITKTGQVYHRTKECKHLNFDITKLTYEQVYTLRNRSGGKYKKCHYCGKDEMASSSIVYITKDGDRYHTSLNCQGLTRNIMTIDISEIGERKECSDCGQGD